MLAKFSRGQQVAYVPTHILELPKTQALIELSQIKDIAQVELGYVIRPSRLEQTYFVRFLRNGEFGYTASCSEANLIEFDWIRQNLVEADLKKVEIGH